MGSWPAINPGIDCFCDLAARILGLAEKRQNEGCGLEPAGRYPSSLLAYRFDDNPLSIVRAAERLGSWPVAESLAIVRREEFENV